MSFLLFNQKSHERLVIIDAYRLETSEGMALQFVDYSDKRSLPITIPDYRHIHQVLIIIEW